MVNNGEEIFCVLSNPNPLNQVTCFAEAGGQHVAGMAKAVEELGLRACLTQSTMDSGEGLPAYWRVHSTDYCIQVTCCFLLLLLLLFPSIFP